MEVLAGSVANQSGDELRVGDDIRVRIENAGLAHLSFGCKALIKPFCHCKRGFRKVS